jgi:hypothetical protein
MNEQLPPACVACAREMICYKNGVYAEMSTGYLQGDVWQCPVCGHQTLLTKLPVVQSLPDHAITVMVTRTRRPGDRAVTSEQMLEVARRVYPQAQVAQHGPTLRLQCGRLVRHFKILDIDAKELALAYINDKGKVVLHPIR